MISAYTTIEEMHKLGLISVRAMNVCRSGEIKTLAQLLKVERYNLRQIRNCGQKTFLELVDIRERYNHYSQEQHIDKIDENPVIVEEAELIDAQKKIELLVPAAVAQLKGWIAWKFNELSVRAKKVFPQLSQLLSVIDIIYSTQKFNALGTKNIGKKTCGELQSFLGEVKAHFEDVTKEIDPNVETLRNNEIEWLVVETGELFPFLLTKECEAVVEFKYKHKISPNLFIAKQYILRCDNPRMNIYRDYYGLNIEGKRHTLTEIGVKNNLSRERIRQLVNKSISLPQSLKDEIQQYLTPLMENVIPFDSLLWEKIQCDNMLDEANYQTALLVCALTDTHTILQIANNDKEYLVNKKLIENVKIRNVLSSIIRVIELRRTIVEKLDILEYIKEGNHLYHKDVSQLCCIYASYLKNNYEVDIDDNRYVMLLPNAIDISIAIEDILEQSGKPMSLDKIKQVFNTLHLSNAIDDATKLKPYIFRNPNIKPKGKTGIYILKSWTNHFTGTLTSYLEHILHTFNEPIPIDDLVDLALDEFPKSNKKSIYSLISGDKDGRFIIYENEYIGLANTPISEIELKERRIMKRYNFNARFEKLRLFVTSRKRMPIQTGSEEEKSLARWISNVLKSNIEATEDQVSFLKDFLSKHETIPQNGTEYNFKQRCDEIKVMVAKTFKLPTAADNLRVYSWLRKNIEKYVAYEDNRKSYFEDLLAFLKDFGFYL